MAMVAMLRAGNCRHVPRAAGLVLVAFLAVYYVVFTGQVKMALYRGGEARESWNETEREVAVQGLIDKLQAATRAAGGEVDEDLTQWRAANPCASRAELRPRYMQRASVPYREPHPRWGEVLREYGKLHRACIRRVGDPTAYFLRRNATVGCKFVVLDTEEAAGLGNRLVMIQSAFVYALLTQRVLLVARGILPPGLLCEPFEGSSWRGFDPGNVVTPFRVGSEAWVKSGSFHNLIDVAMRVGEPPETYPYAVANGEGYYTEQVDSRFFCDTEQGFYEKVPWVYFMGCIYFTPKFFAVPSFRPVLDALFPDRAILTDTLRDVLAPADPVWEQVKRIEVDHRLRDADRRLGIQVRYRYLAAQFARMHAVVEDRILQCGLANGLLPNPKNETVSANVTTSVFVASLFEGVKKNLSATLGGAVEVVQLSNEGFQKYGVEIFQTALAEIITLSLSDFLFVTPQSTFSGCAQGYGGLVPWFIEFREDVAASAPPCTRGQSIDMCFQVPYDYAFKCPHDAAVNKYDISGVYPDIQRCLEADTPGLQLITLPNPT